jgi:hypothetical protein
MGVLSALGLDQHHAQKKPARARPDTDTRA